MLQKSLSFFPKNVPPKTRNVSVNTDIHFLVTYFSQGVHLHYMHLLSTAPEKNIKKGVILNIHIAYLTLSQMAVNPYYFDAMYLRHLLFFSYLYFIKTIEFIKPALKFIPLDRSSGG